LDNDTWSLELLPKDKAPIGGKWVFVKKFDENGNVNRYKARFVAQGYNQVKGCDFNETFSPTAKLSTVQMLTQIVCDRDWELHQLDVKTAYLNAQIDCAIYVEQPTGFEKSGNGEKLYCHLNKSLYGLKQSGRMWNATLNDYLIAHGFTRSNVDMCLYSKSHDMHVVKILIFVDDMIVASDDVYLMHETKKMLSERFKMSDIGELKWFLGIQFKREPDCISLNQSVYLSKLLEKHGMQDCKRVATPYDILKFDDENAEMSNISLNVYRSIVGGLIYAMCCTRPDLSFIVTKLSQYLHVPVTQE
jgi:hypothetical protein